MTDQKKNPKRTAARQDQNAWPTEHDRRDPSVKDRRAVRRGGRRAGDVIKGVATFVHQLLTEPPR